MEDLKRLEREKDFHNDTFAKDSRKAAKKYYLAASGSKQFYRNLLYKNVNDIKVLEYGCGPGSSSFTLSKKGAKVTAIDISDVAIELAKEKAEYESVSIDFKVMNAESLDFKADSFDRICGSGIIHHLDVEKSLSEIKRTLKKNGNAIFYEPLGHNPIINIYRFFTPKMRTEDEHPLLMSDIQKAKEYFLNVNVTHFNLFSTLAAFFSPIKKPLDSLDAWLFKVFPVLKKYSWIVVIELSNPIK